MKKLIYSLALSAMVLSGHAMHAMAFVQLIGKDNQIFAVAYTNPTKDTCAKVGQFLRGFHRENPSHEGAPSFKLRYSLAVNAILYKIFEKKDRTLFPKIVAGLNSFDRDLCKETAKVMSKLNSKKRADVHMVRLAQFKFALRSADTVLIKAAWQNLPFKQETEKHRFLAGSKEHQDALNNYCIQYMKQYNPRALPSLKAILKGNDLIVKKIDAAICRAKVMKGWSRATGYPLYSSDSESESESDSDTDSDDTSDDEQEPAENTNSSWTSLFKNPWIIGLGVTAVIGAVVVWAANKYKANKKTAKKKKAAKPKKKTVRFAL